MGVGGVYLFVCVYFRVACTTRLIYLRRLFSLLFCSAAAPAASARVIACWNAAVSAWVYPWWSGGGVIWFRASSFV